MLSRTMKLALVAVGSATLIANPASARTAPKHVLATEAFASVSEMPGSLGGWPRRGRRPRPQYPLSADAGCLRERELVAEPATQDGPSGGLLAF
jgi:hypothetical protein